MVSEGSGAGGRALELRQTDRGVGIRRDGGIDGLTKQSLRGWVLQDQALCVRPVCSLINLPGWQPTQQGQINVMQIC